MTDCSYKNAYQCMDTVNSLKPDLSKLKNWHNWWNVGKEIIFRTYKKPRIPNSKLCEVIYVGWKNTMLV